MSSGARLFGDGFNTVEDNIGVKRHANANADNVSGYVMYMPRINTCLMQQQHAVVPDREDGSAAAFDNIDTEDWLRVGPYRSSGAGTTNDATPITAPTSGTGLVNCDVDFNTSYDRHIRRTDMPKVAVTDWLDPNIASPMQSVPTAVWGRDTRMEMKDAYAVAASQAK